MERAQARAHGRPRHSAISSWPCDLELGDCPPRVGLPAAPIAHSLPKCSPNTPRCSLVLSSSLHLLRGHRHQQAAGEDRVGHAQVRGGGRGGSAGAAGDRRRAVGAGNCGPAGLLFMSTWAPIDEPAGSCCHCCLSPASTSLLLLLLLLLVLLRCCRRPNQMTLIPPRAAMEGQSPPLAKPQGSLPWLPAVSASAVPRLSLDGSSGGGRAVSGAEQRRRRWQRGEGQRGALAGMLWMFWV